MHEEVVPHLCALQALSKVAPLCHKAPMTFDTALIARAADILLRARKQNLKIATAESCTGGLVAALFTEIPGSSAAFDRGFVVYSNAAKHDMLGVPEQIIDANGAVSAQTACAMANGALAHSQADIAIAITGVAGPGGGSAEKPVGLVYLASARKGAPTLPVEMRYGDLGRANVRRAALESALNLIESRL
jgi:nicotinamide-nucleotide amidase